MCRLSGMQADLAEDDSSHTAAASAWFGIKPRTTRTPEMMCSRKTESLPVRGEARTERQRLSLCAVTSTTVLG